MCGGTLSEQLLQAPPGGGGRAARGGPSPPVRPRVGDATAPPRRALRLRRTALRPRRPARPGSAPRRGQRPAPRALRPAARRPARSMGVLWAGACVLALVLRGGPTHAFPRPAGSEGRWAPLLSAALQRPPDGGGAGRARVAPASLRADGPRDQCARGEGGQSPALGCRGDENVGRF